MNRYTCEHLHKILDRPRAWDLAWLVLAAACEPPALIHAPSPRTYRAVFELLRTKGLLQHHQKALLILLKYIVRVCVPHSTGFAHHKTAEDPYSTVSFWQFNGQFGYEPDQAGYVPYGYDTEASRLLRDYYDSVQHDRMLDAWNRLRPALLAEGGGKPILVYRFEAPHVYFMKRGDSGEVKIGVSIHPGIRRKQLMAQFGVAIDLLHVLPSAGYEEEGRLHQQFAALRSCGEWFRPEAELLTYIAQLQTAPPPPPKPSA